jgi:hypothetical protein
MTAEPAVIDRIFDRLTRALSAGSPDQLREPFKVSEIIQALVPYRTYRNELGVDTLQDYEHAILDLLSGERGLLICDPDTVAVIRKELGSPDPDTTLLRRLQTVEVRLGAVRMPAMERLRSPVARPEEDARDAMAAELPRIPDALAIGAVMDREDAERAEAEAVSSASPGTHSAPTAAAIVLDSPPAQTLPLAAPTAAAPTAAVPTATVPTAVAPTPAVIALPVTPLSVPPVASVYGDPIDFRGLRHAPADIGGVIFLFGMVARELGFNVEAMSSGFPRCEAKRQLAPGKWTRLRIEFELESRQFRDAGRNPAACDLIVCWRDTWPDRPASLDVLSLEQVLPTLGRRE